MSDGRREHEKPGDRRTSTFLVEHYWPGVTAEAFGRAADRVRASAERLGERRRIRYLHSTLVPEDEAAFCVFEAESQQLVEEAYARAEVTFERIRAAVETVPGSRGPERKT
jgi:hypothetical protein